MQSLGEDQPILERTRITKDPKEIVSRARYVIETSNWLSVCSTLGWLRTVHNAASDLLEEILEKCKRGDHKGVRWICRIDERDLDIVKNLLDPGMQIRHLDNIPLNFSVTDKEFNFTVDAGENDKVTYGVLMSNEPAYIAQFNSLFEDLWKNGIEARDRIKEIEERVEPQNTGVFNGAEATTRVRLQVISGARKRLDFCDDSLATVAGVKFEPVMSTIIDAAKRRGIGVRFITEITKDNISACKELMKYVDLRHLDGVKGNFVVTEDKYYAFTGIKEEVLPAEIIYSNVKLYAEHNQYRFETLWNNAVPAERRIREIEQGIERGETRIISDLKETVNLAYRLIEDTKQEVVIILASERTIMRNVSMYEHLIRKSRDAGIKIRVLLPISNPKLTAELLDGTEFRSIRPINTGIAIYDRSKMFITQYLEPESATTTRERPPIANIFTTNKETIAGMASVFEALWEQSELREKEEKARRQSELLQDILTHDIRNYNQASRMSAELLKTELSKNKGVRFLTDSLIQGIDNSTLLVDKAKKLGKIMSEEKPQLCPVNVIQSIGNALAIVRDAYPKKNIFQKKTYRTKKQQKGIANALADNLLDEAFANILSNSVRYTEGNDVRIETLLQEEENEHEDESGKGFWKITIIDHGIGIPDELKENVFSRYFRTRVGSGLGMSIVHGLIVERYHGKVGIRNRIKDDYTKGTAVDVWLPKA